MKVEVMRNRRRIWWFRGEAYVNGDLAAGGEFQAAMENHKD
jgi:3-hydroxymyristoyl/3-hydroxydecanoyl-(acyl carrier protein) dehydratase